MLICANGLYDNLLNPDLVTAGSCGIPLEFEWANPGSVNDDTHRPGGCPASDLQRLRDLATIVAASTVPFGW